MNDSQKTEKLQSCGQELYGRIALTYESGPYDIDTPTVVAKVFVRAIEKHLLGENT